MEEKMKQTAADAEGHRKRIRERFINGGLETFQDYEILELLLTYAIPRVDTKPIAKQLIAHFGSFHAVLEATVPELTAVKGIGENSAVFISMLLQVYRAYERDRRAEKEPLSSVDRVKEHCRGLFVGEREEKLYLICLNARLKPVADVLVCSGTVNGISVLSRQIAAEAMRHSAIGVILTHNHPAGGTEPSAEDLRFTEDCRRALNALDIRLYDHIIVGDRAVSLRESGRISF